MSQPQTVIRTRRRKKNRAAHHGGTWKIAYADFMTAMMAFFLVMWLLSTSTENQRTKIADYFRIPGQPQQSRGERVSQSDSIIPGGGDDFSKQEGEVQRRQRTPAEASKKMQSLRLAKARLEAIINSDPRLSHFKSNLLLRLTDDGLLIQITDSQERPMFRTGSEMPERYMTGILQALVPLLKELPNGINVTGHTDARPYAGGSTGYSNWELSAGRANAARRVLAAAGLEDSRFLRVTGSGSRLGLANISPDSPMNRRISILVLSNQKQRQLVLEDTSLPPGTQVSTVGKDGGSH